jgi:hypothetical protein
MIAGVLLGAPGIVGGSSSIHGATPSSAQFSIGPVPVAGIGPDAGPFTVIDPACAVSGSAPLTQSGATFTVTSSFTGALVDECPNSVLNGSGYTITPSSGTNFGVQINTTSNVTVEDVVVGGTPFEAVEVINSTDSVVTDVTSSVGMDYGVLGSNNVGLNLTDSFLNGTAVAGVVLGDSQNVVVTNTFACDGADGLLEIAGTGVTITNFNATENRNGIELDRVTDALLADDNVSRSAVDGIYESSTNLVTISNVYAAVSAIGISGFLAYHTTIADANLSSATDFGYYGYFADGLNLSDSNLSDSLEYGAAVAFGSSTSFWADSVNQSGLDGFDIENTSAASVGDSWGTGDGWNGLRAVDTFDLTTWANVFDNVSGVTGNGTELYATSDTALHGDQDSGENVGVLDVGSTELSVTDANTTNDTVGLLWYDDSAATVANSSCLESFECVAFLMSTDASVVNYTADNATYEAFSASFTNQLSISDSVAVGSAYYPSEYGITLGGCYETTLFNDSMANFAFGVQALDVVNATFDDLDVTNASQDALALITSSGLSVENGNFSSSDVGFDLDGLETSSIIGNTVYHVTDDFEFDADPLFSVQIYWNNFIDGLGWDVTPGQASSTNVVFADGYPGGGNYWSNWTSPDSKSGPLQNLPGSDGIVDNPLPIAGALEDPYPLTRAVSIPETSVQFLASGLPNGVSWGVTFNGTEGSATANSLIFSTNTAAIGVALGYSVAAPSGWNVTPVTGQVTTSGSALVVQLVFTPASYAVTFSQTGLPSGTAWSVTVNGTVISGSSGAVGTSLPNGTYPYTVNPIAGYTITPSSGVITVASSGATTGITFTTVLYPVEFTEHGLPAGTTWSVTFGGSTQSRAASTISFSVVNGSYAYTVGNVSGYSTSAGSGTQQVSGPGASVQVGFSPNSNSGFGAGSPLFWALIAVITLLAVALIAVVVRGRRKPPAAATTWTPPPAATAGTSGSPPSPPAAGSPAPPPGASGTAPEWKE